MRFNASRDGSFERPQTRVRLRFWNRWPTSNWCSLPPESIGVAFAVGALAGLRLGEVLALDWRDLDLAARRINVRLQVQNGRLTVLKDDESRMVPIQKALLPILSSWKLRSGGEGMLFRPMRYGGTSERKPSFIRQHTLRRHLSLALASCSLPSLTRYQATRHTFAS